MELRTHRTRGSPVGWFLLGFGVGAATYALSDPHRGMARQAKALEKSRSVASQAREDARRRALDLKSRVQGAVHEAAARWQEDDASDEVIAERIRAQLGRPVSHPRALEVRVERGCAILSGPILAPEVDDLLATVRSVRGVREIRNLLEVHLKSDHVPSLQGSGSRHTRG